MGLFTTLLPSRNALFELRLDIQDLANVPVLTGAFATEWKFRKTSSGSGPKSKGKEKEVSSGNKAHRTLSTSSLRPTISRSTAHTRSSSASSSRSHSSGSSVSSHHSHPHKHGPNHSHLVSKISRKSSGPQVSTKGRGETALVEIHDHFCRWNQSIVANVRMPIESGSSSSKGKEKEGEGGEVVGRLGERELHLAVHQYHSVESPDRILRLGHLTLNLAEYAGKGKVVRRYLLDSGKTNATLKLEIELTQIGGQRKWTAPPITKGQLAHGGLETLVAGSNIVTTPVPSASSANLSSAASANPSPDPSRSSTPLQSSSAVNLISAGADPRVKQGFVLPTGTEAIIEALFNPFPSSNAGPFTYPVQARTARPTNLSFQDASFSDAPSSTLEVPLAGTAPGRRRLGVRSWKPVCKDDKSTQRERSKSRERERKGGKKDEGEFEKVAKGEATTDVEMEGRSKNKEGVQLE